MSAMPRFRCQAAKMLSLMTLLFAALPISGAVAVEDDPGERIPVTIRPAVAGPVLFTEQSLAPAPNASLCSIHTNRASGLLDCLVLSHEQYSYVDLEQVEPLLKNKRVLCDENAKLFRSTTIVLEFIDKYGLDLAISQWHDGKGLLFWLEDPLCFHPDGSRSFYLGQRIDWDTTHNRAVIHATPEFADPKMENSNWGTSLIPMRTEVPLGYFAEARPSTGKQSFVYPEYSAANHNGTLGRRDNDDGTSALVCTGGLLPALMGSKLKNIGRCALGAPFAAILAPVISAKETSKHIKAAAVLANFAPGLGLVVAGLGTLIAPTRIAVEQTWDRTWNDEKFMIPWGIEESSFTEEHYKVPHLSFTCAGCHAFGKFEAVLGVQFALHARGHSGPDVCVNSIKDRMRPDGPRRRRRGEDNRLPHEIIMELGRIVKHDHRRERVRRIFKKRDPQEIEAAHTMHWTRTESHDIHFAPVICTPEDPTYPTCNLQEVDNYHRMCDNYLDNDLYHPDKTIALAFNCIAKSIGGNTECWNHFHEAADYFEGPRDFITKFLKRHLKKADFEMKIDQDIDVYVQPQVSMDLTAGVWMDLDIGIRGAVVPSWGFLASIGPSSPIIFNGGRAAIDRANKASEGQTGWGEDPNNGMGKMTWGIPAFRLEQTFSGNVKADFALPGFNATISKGTIKLDLLRQKEDMVTSTVDIANIEYLPSKINFTGGDPRLGATWSVGPAFDFTLTPNMFLGGKKSWSDTHTHIMTPFAFGGALEVIRFDLSVGGAPRDHKPCIEEMGKRGKVWDSNGISFELIFRFGARLYASFFGYRLDTSFAGKLQKTAHAISGLYYSKPIHVHCHALEDDTSPAEFLGKHVNNFLDKIQKPIKDSVAELSNVLSKAGKEKFKDADEEYMCGPRAIDGTCLGFEAFKGYHNLHHPEDTEIYAPVAIPETTAECSADEAAKHLINGTKKDCNNLPGPAVFNFTKELNTSRAEEEAIANARLCKYTGKNCKKPQL